MDWLWYSRNPLALLLLPCSWLFRLVAALRRLLYSAGLMKSRYLPVPVIVVGNISVGGTGKTPLVVWIVEELRRMGLNPGVISRGYGGQAESWPQFVDADADPDLVGDEPVLLARRLLCPLAVAPDRPAAGQMLIDDHAVDVLVADDGLQHYALQRDLEIAVVDGSRGMGNGHCLPAGPLREPESRLKTVDMVVVNGQGLWGHGMQMRLGTVTRLADGFNSDIQHWAGQTVHAVAGVGNPARFFKTLRDQGLQLIEHAFPDHYEFVELDLDFEDDSLEPIPVVMTEKDAVKCYNFVHGPLRERLWYVPVTAEPEPDTARRLQSLLSALPFEKYMDS